MLRFLLGAAILAAAIAAVTKPGPHGFAPVAVEALSQSDGAGALIGAVRGDCASDPEACAKALRALLAVEENDYVVARETKLTAALLGAKTELTCVGLFGGWSCSPGS